MPRLATDLPLVTTAGPDAVADPTSPAELQRIRATLGLDLQAFAAELCLTRTQIWRLLQGRSAIRPQVARLAMLLLERHELRQQRDHYRDRVLAMTGQL